MSKPPRTLREIRAELEVKTTLATAMADGAVDAAASRAAGIAATIYHAAALLVEALESERTAVRPLSMGPDESEVGE